MTKNKYNLIVPPGYEYIDFSDNNFRKAYEDCFDEDKEFVLIMGPGGCGKSEIYKMVGSYYKERAICCSSTGVSAYNLETDVIKPKTIHSNLMLEVVPYYDRDVLLKGLFDAFKKKKVFLLDEVSMVNANLLDMLIKHIKLYNNQNPESKMRFIMFGDPLQLPPVWNEETLSGCDAHLKANYTKDKWNFFNSKFMEKLMEKEKISVHVLDHIFRQSDAAYLEVLSHIRYGSITQADCDYLNKRCNPLALEQHEDLLCLVPTNKMVDEINTLKIKALVDSNAEHYEYKAKERILKDDFKINDYAYRKRFTLYKGERVMCLRNRYNAQECIFQNGTVGTIIGFRKYEDMMLPVVKADGRTERIFTVFPMTFEDWHYFNNKDGSLGAELRGTAEQLPLRPAYAVTYHKAQGLSLDNAFLKFPEKNGTFKKALVYLGLSRVRTPEGLFLESEICPEHVLADKNCVSFVKSCNN